MAHKTAFAIRVFTALSIILLFSATGTAQQPRAWEVFGGYSFQRSDVRQYYKTSPILYALRGQYVNLNGWNVALTENMNHWFGGTLDVSGHYHTSQVGGVTTEESVHSLLYGPRFTAHASKVAAFGHILVGAAHVRAKVTPVGPKASDFSFAFALGGGVDLSFSDRIAVRLLQADYFRADTLGTRPNSYRAGAGIVLKFGEKK